MSLCRQAREKTNMDAESLRSWRASEAFRQYKNYIDKEIYQGVADSWIRLTKRVLDGSASKQECRRVLKELRQHKSQGKGELQFGSGSSKVSARTARLRCFGFDPTGRYSN